MTTPAGNPVIRKVEPRDGPALHKLLTASIPDVLPDRDRWLARWEWQYWCNPFRGIRPAGWVFSDGDRILGHLGAVYLPMRLGENRVTGVVGADYAVADEFLARGGMFAGLELAQKLFSEGSDCLVMATTANEKTGAVFGRYGARPVEWTREFWRAPATLQQQVRTCRGGNNRVIRGIMTCCAGRWLLRMMTTCYRIANHVPVIPIPQNCRIEVAVPRFADNVGCGWPQDGRSTYLGVDCSQEYLDWRYGRHPENDHMRIVVARDTSGSLLGVVVVLQEQRDDRHVMYIEDVSVISQRQDVLKTMLCFVLRLAYQHGVEYLVTAPGNRSSRNVYWELGFEDRARNAPAVVIYMPPSLAASISSEAPVMADEQLEFWHGMMF